MSRKSSSLAAAAAILVVSAFTGPAVAASGDEGSASAAPKTISVSCETFTNDGAVSETVTVASGTPVVLSLCSNPTTGYRWSEPVSSDPAVASVSGWVYEAPSGGRVGASGNEHLTITTSAPGSAVITASYGQPWEGGTTSDWGIEVTVQVRDANQLAIGCDEFQATPDMTTSVDLAAGSSLVLSLCSNPSTGFRWSDAASSDPAVASVSAWAYQELPSESGMTGVAGAEHLTVDAHATGAAVITASYDQPWEGGEKGAWSLELTVNVD